MVKKIDILDALKTHIAWKDTQGQYLGANQFLLDVLGLSEAELIGKTIFDFVSREEAEQITLNDQAVFDSKEPKTFHEFIGSEANRQVFVIHKSPLFDDDGNLVGLVAVATDISNIELKDAKLNQLLVAKRNYIDGMEYFNDIANIFNGMTSMLPANIYWKDVNGVYLGCNDATLGYISRVSPAENLIGKTIFDVVDSEFAQLVHETDNRIMREGKSQTIEEEGPNADGEVVTFVTHKVPVRNDAGVVIGLLGVSFDISQKRQMMDALLAAKQQAESASRAKSEFIMNMSHDIRTPFVGILGFAELLSQQEDNPAKLEMIGYIRESSERLLGLLNEVIDIVHEDSGQKVKNDSINMRDLVDNLQTMMLARIKLDKLTLNVTVAENVPTVIFSDKQGINRILLNLIGNAIKFTYQGSISLEITVLKSDAESLVLRMIVTDTGIGIPENMRQEIFERFTRLSNSHKSKARGSGLGLYFVKSIVERLGGEITLNSEECVGSQFIIDLPCRLSLIVPQAV